MLYVVCRELAFDLSLSHPLSLSLSLSPTREVATRVRGSHVLRVVCCVLRATRRRVARLAVGWRVCVCVSVSVCAECLEFVCWRL